jgi:hypothetical protein
LCSLHSAAHAILLVNTQRCALQDVALYNVVDPTQLDLHALHAAMRGGDAAAAVAAVTYTAHLRLKKRLIIATILRSLSPALVSALGELTSPSEGGGGADGGGGGGGGAGGGAGAGAGAGGGGGGSGGGADRVGVFHGNPDELDIVMCMSNLEM